MQIAVVYASRTGNTRRAAELIGAAIESRGHTVSVQPVDALDFKALADADLVVLGTWVAGHFVIGQKPGDARRLARIPKLTGKPVAIFLTYAINPGRALSKLEAALTREGADVVGGYAWKRTALPAGVEDFVDGVLSAVKPASA
ncbi:MAG TPA: flavodoxin family protein [Acidimicrobiales bacterium]|nr:flavodoxin family protein [Acidimicrobiales bacterium]